MDLGLSDKVAVVQASTAGLGRAVAEALLDEGARVAISGRNRDRLGRALEGLEPDHGERVFGEVVDVTDSAAMARHLAEVRGRFGSLDILVTNSGGPPPGPAEGVSAQQLRDAYELILEATVGAVNEVLPWMRENGFGRILGMTSSSVRHPIPGLALSNTMRAGLTGYFKTLSQEVARDGVLVNTICTGMFDTERLAELFRARSRESGRSEAEERARAAAAIPVGRIGDAREFGAMAAFMVSPRASFLNGAALAYDGGASTFLL